MNIKTLAKLIILVILTTSCTDQEEPVSDPQAEGDLIPQLESENISFCERAIEYKFPPSSSEYDFFDNQEFYVIGHLKLAQADIPEFKRKFSFSNQSKTEETYMGLSNLKPTNQNIPENTSFSSGKLNQHIHWNMYFHEESGRVWISVSYQDWNG